MYSVKRKVYDFMELSLKAFGLIIRFPPYIMSLFFVLL